jgi:hypothetical protein
MYNSREAKEAAFYHDSDIEPTKIRYRSHLSPSIRYGSGGRHIFKAFPLKPMVGRSNRPFPEVQVADQVWENRRGSKFVSVKNTIVGCSGRGLERKMREEDETRYWPWMTDIEIAWQPPTEPLQVDLLEMAKPNTRKSED